MPISTIKKNPCNGTRYPYAVAISGGFDSIASYLTIRDSFRIPEEDIFTYHVKYGAPYENKEINCSMTLSKYYEMQNFHVFNMPIVDPELGNVPDLENEKVNGRNILICYLGAMNGDNVVLGALAEDFNPTTIDKNGMFFQKINQLFNVAMYGKIVVTSPCRHLTKTELLNQLLNEYGRDEVMFLLENTVGCYEPREHICCKCKWCLSKWVMMVNAGLNPDEIGLKDPWKSKTNKLRIRTMVKAHLREDYSHFKKKRCAELIMALEAKDVNVAKLIK